MTETLGEFLHRYRKRAGFNQKAVAITIHVDRRTIERWESDAVSISARRLRTLLELYKVPECEWAAALRRAP